MTLQAGTYRARGLSGALGFTKEHNPQVAVELQILDGDGAGAIATWRGYFTAKSEARTLEALRILGWKTDDLSDLAGIGDNEVQVVIQEEEFDGKIQLKVAWVNRLGGVGLKEPMSPQEAKAFAASMRGKALASRSATTTATAGKPAAPKPPAQRPVPAAGAPEDEIPF